MSNDTNPTNATPDDAFLDYLNARANDAASFEGPEFEGPEGARRAIQHFNAHPLRTDTGLEKGGFAIEKTHADAFPGFGPLESIPLSTGVKTMYTSRTITGFIVGWSPRYWLLHGESPADGSYKQYVVPQYVDPGGLTGPAKPDGTAGAAWKCEGRCSLFIVPQADPAKQVWVVTFKGKEVVDSINPALKAIQDEIANTRRVLGIVPGAPMSPADIAVTLTVVKPVMSGKVGFQSPVSPIAIVPLGDDRAANIGRLAGPKLAARFMRESQEVKALIDKGAFKPDPNANFALGAAAAQMQIGAPGSAPATTPAGRDEVDV